MAERHIRIGSWVRLRTRVRSGPQKARVERFVPSLAPGAVLLSAPLDGLKWWNREELVPTNRPRRANAD